MLETSKVANSILGSQIQIPAADSVLYKTLHGVSTGFPAGVGQTAVEDTVSGKSL